MIYKRWKYLVFCAIFLNVGLPFTEQAALYDPLDVSDVTSAYQSTILLRQDENNCSSTDTGICLTKDCTLTAAMLISAMDPSVDPCDNFYDFTCANFIRTNPVPDDVNKINTLLEFNKNFYLQLKNLMEGMTSLKGPKVIYRMQEFYHVCINTTYQKESELQALKNFTQRELDWPLAWGKDWQPKYSTPSEYMEVYEEKGYGNYWAKIGVGVDENNPSRYKVKIDYDPYTITAESVLSKNDLETDEKFIKDLFYLLGKGDNESTHDDINDMRQIYKKNQSDLSPTESHTNVSDELKNILETLAFINNITFRLLYELTDEKFDWLSIVNRKMRNKHTFTEDDYVSVLGVPKEIKKKFHILNRLPLRSVINVMGWNALYSILPEIDNHDLEELFTKYNKKLQVKYGPLGEPEKPKPRWRRCLEQINVPFTFSVTRMFLEHYIDRSEKQSAEELVHLIRESYIQNIRQSEWLDEETKNSAIRKANKIKRFIAYPDFIFDDDKLDKFYEKVVPEVHSTLFENWIDYKNYTVDKSTPDLNDNESKLEVWNIDPLVVNAFYDPQANSIWLPFGILQLPFFQNKRLSALNFGMIGAVIGHEIGHAFDNIGRSYNENGEEKNWWSKETEEIFQTKGKCFSSQYNSFCPEELQGENERPICVIGENTLGENLADFTGLNAAYMAYKLWVEKYGEEKRLPGLQEYSPEQLFFMGFGYQYCENVPADKWKTLYQFNPHSPGRYRVLGALSNNRIFREVFQCPKGTMNKDDDSCTMW